MSLNKIIVASLALIPLQLMADSPLKGTPIGTSEGYNYERQTVERDIQYRAFDGDLSTYFATNARSYTWVGLDLGATHVIDRVGWSPRNDVQGEKRVQLGVIQGANSPDFMDAVPLYVITDRGSIGSMSYGAVECSRGFRYVRYVSTSDARCNIAELEFYGTPGEGDDSYYYQVTNLPTVVVNTPNSFEPYDKEHDIEANIIIISDNKINIDKPGTVRERGNGSRAFPKKPWRLKFDKKQNVLDAPAKAKKWTLINNFGDKTLMRNIVAFEIARRVGMKWVPWCQPVDVILNGEYKGCYQLCDQVEVNPGRLEITEMDETCTSGDDLTGGYFFEIDAYASQEPVGSWFNTPFKALPVTIKSPDDGGTTEQYNYIKNYLNDFLKTLFSAAFSTEGYDYRNRFDIDSFVKHFIVNELVGNTDTYWSTYMYKERLDPMIYTGPVWDFDLGFDNDGRTYPIHSHANDYLYTYSGTSAANGMKDVASRILKADKRTKDDITKIWSIARNDAQLDTESLNEYIDEIAENLDASQKLNFTRWNILNERVHENPRALGSYAAEVEAVKAYLETRFEDLDRLFDYDDTISGAPSIVEDGVVNIMVFENKISVVSASADYTFTVFNLAGSKIFQGKGETQQLSSGLYIVVANGATNKVVIK